MLSVYLTPCPFSLVYVLTFLVSDESTFAFFRLEKRRAMLNILNSEEIMARESWSFWDVWRPYTFHELLHAISS